MEDPARPSPLGIRILLWLVLLAVVGAVGMGRLAGLPAGSRDATEQTSDAAMLNEKGLAHFNNGNFEAARSAFARAAQLRPDDAVLRKNLAQSHAGLGWTAYREQRFEDALAEFDHALAQNLEEGDFLIGKAAAWHKLQREQDAMNALTEGLRLSPNHAGGHGLLGEIYYAQNQFDLAVREWDTAVRLDPNNQVLRTRLERVRTTHGALRDFHSRSVNLFTVLFEGPERDADAQRVLSLLDEASQRIGLALSYYPEDRITVVLYTQEQFRNATHGPGWASALYDGKIHVPLGGTIDDIRLGQVVAHEYTHAVVHRLSNSRAPTWLNEGLAMYFDNAPAPPATTRWPQLQELAGSFMAYDNAQASSAYETSRLATQYLVDRYGLARVTSLLKDLADPSEPFETRFEHALFVSLPEFDNAWRTSASQRPGRTAAR